MTNDPIADMLTRIRNANQRFHKSLRLPSSNVKTQIAQILRDEGYINGWKLRRHQGKPELTIYLKHVDQQHAILGLKRISKPGLRVYAKAAELPKVLNGFGIAIISTSKGIVTDRIARDHNLGGEVMAFIW